MYLHIGKNCIIPHENIIAIIDYESVGESEINKEFFKTAYEEGFIEKLAEDSEIKSYVITEGIDQKKEDEHMMTKIYASNISAVTLVKRMNLT